MRRIASSLLALISFACVATAATRPHYGGTLRGAMQSAPSALTLPPASDPAAYWDVARVLSLVGDTLVKIDAEDRPQPALAVAWQRNSTSRHWQFTLRRAVKFHDGSVASPAAIAQILGALHPNWVVRVSAGTMNLNSGFPNADSPMKEVLTIDTDAPAPSLLAELALPRNLILTRNASGIPIGTGPFRAAEFQPGKSLKLISSDESWSGRPFIDGVEIEFGKSLREQTLALELGRADIVETMPETAPTAASASARSRVSSSLPVELMALVFPANSSAQDARVRQALALSIDRKPIQFVLLKGAAEPTASILPNWLTGYSAVFL